PTGDTGSRGEPGGPGQRVGPAQILVVTDQPVLADLIGLTLNHGNFAIRAAQTVDAAVAALELGEWHLVALDMDVEGLGTEQVMARLGYAGNGGNSGNGMTRTPIIALTRRG